MKTGNEKIDRHVNPAVPHLIPEDELPDDQLNRQIEVDSEIQRLLNDLIPPQYVNTVCGQTGVQIAHDIEIIGRVRDLIQDIICDELGLLEGVTSEAERAERLEQFEMNFFPFLRSEEEDK